MNEPWHDANHDLSFQIVCMPAATTDLDFNAGIIEGASAWNTADTGISFGELQLTDCNNLLPASVRITIKPYTVSGTDRCAGGIACVFNQSTTYPHLTTQEFLIKRIPQTGFTWASIPDANNRISSNQIYLPMTMIHEFGHTAGLWHSANLNDVMASNTPAGVVIQAPKSNDISAMKSIYMQHTSH